MLTACSLRHQSTSCYNYTSAFRIKALTAEPIMIFSKIIAMPSSSLIVIVVIIVVIYANLPVDSFGHSSKQLQPPFACHKTFKSIGFSANKKALSDYHFDEKYEAGIQLLGTEVKSCRGSNVQLSDGFAQISDGECWLYNIHIAEYPQAGPYYQHQPKRRRKLLLHKRQVSNEQ